MQSREESVFDRLKRAKIMIVEGAPSYTAQPEVYESLQQDPSEKILDDRPEPEKTSHLSLCLTEVLDTS